MILRPMIEIEKKDVLEYLEKNNMESNLSRADKEKFKNMISKIRENILEFKEYFFIGDNKKVLVVRSIRRSRFCIFNNNIK